MQFYRKKGRTMGVPIVPMIDILTILLIFFIVHTQWKKPQTLLKIDVPGAEFIEGAPSTEQRAVLAVTEDIHLPERVPGGNRRTAGRPGEAEKGKSGHQASA